ncbi:MAG: copper resistance CopC family protein [Gammaproteobacteria bacterium]
MGTVLAAAINRVLALIGLTVPGMALAHAILVKTLPAEDAAPRTPPEEIEVWFNEGVGDEYKALAVIDAEGARVDNQDARLGFFDRSYLHVSVPPLPPGVYTVRYRVQSADGHIVSGKFNFSVAGP